MSSQMILDFARYSKNTGMEETETKDPRADRREMRWDPHPKTFKRDTCFTNFWDINTLNYMKNYPLFSACIESKKYPIFVNQFQQKKPNNIMYAAINISYKWKDTNFQEYYAEKFVNMSKTNTNTFGGNVKSKLIENYDLIPTDTELGSVYAFESHYAYPQFNDL